MRAGSIHQLRYLPKEEAALQKQFKLCAERENRRPT
jgi:hypothetical protein